MALLGGPDHVFEFANPLYVQIVGRSDVNELLGKPVREACYFNLLLEPSVDRAGRVEGILAHAVDVTEQVRARQRIEELAQQLRDQLETHVDPNRELRDTGAARDRAIADLPPG